MKKEIPIHYDPAEAEKSTSELWFDSKAFAATPQPGVKKYVIMMPLPNVTGALHMGHAMDNVMQDLLIRWHRMMGNDTLWMVGSDHAGIATQAVVEKRLFELEGKTRHDIGREALVKRIWQWKEEYQKRIYGQLKTMGCSCDWNRARFTMDKVCARAVRHTFFSMFRDGIIYQGTRLVNWDCHLQTAVADDEIIYETVDSHFWYMRYPIIDPEPGDPEYVVVATTRPETMLGDTAVACHPDPQGELERLILQTRNKLDSAPKRDKKELKEEIERLEKRRETHLPQLLRLAEMARNGRQVLLPLQNRPIPLITDPWAKPGLGSGCVKITPAHDPNDYEVWQRHVEEMEIINILNPDGTLNENAGAYAGMDRFAARELVFEDLKKQDLMESVEDRQVDVGHSDRSKTPIEPYLSLQWFVRMGDVEDGIVCGRDTDKRFVAPGMAQAAIQAAEGEWKSATDRDVKFHPDADRYAGTYLNWLGEKRDWCISRQLWWGHRIPIWKKQVNEKEYHRTLNALEPLLSRNDICIRIGLPDGTSQIIQKGENPFDIQETANLMVCLQDDQALDECSQLLEAEGLEQDPDVLDTWFSSALWPHSTLGWPDPETAQVEDGQTPLGAVGNAPNCLDSYFPGSCLVTGRDIVTLWVARMIIMGLYNLGDVPFTDVFIHANILDGKGERMSKSKGNGIDPVDIIERYGTDAMRYVLCELQTGMQDIRLPIQAVSPFTGELVDLGAAKHGKTIFTYICPKSGKEFDVTGTMKDIPSAKIISERFEVGVHFCTKLWNAARLAFMNLEGYSFTPRDVTEFHEADRWILSRLSKTIQEVNSLLEEYNPSAAINACRSFFWGELCDWYLEMIKGNLADESKAPSTRQVLATVLDRVLSLLHPFVPFITETLWQSLNELAPERGISAPLPQSEILVKGVWPERTPEWEEEELEKRMGTVQDIVREIRNVRSKHGLSPRKPLKVIIRGGNLKDASFEPLLGIVKQITNLESLELSDQDAPAGDAARAVVGNLEIFVLGAVDVEKERTRLKKQRDDLTKKMAGSQKKLSNKGFVEKAKDDIVQKERDKLAKMEAELKAVEENLLTLVEE